MHFDVSKNSNSPIICNVPHSGLIIPEDFKEEYLLSGDALKNEVLFMADNYTDLLYSELLYVSSYIKSNVSRIFLDIERFKNPDEEPMSKVGMSAFYTLTSDGKPLRNIAPTTIEFLTRIYDEYHTTLTELVAESLERNNFAVVVDCHSFPSIPRSYEPDKNENRPDICIGVDEYHTPKELVDIVKRNFESAGYSVEINSPFAGSIVPMKYSRTEQKVSSIMIEINRKLYMNEETYLKNKNFSEISKIISRAVIVSLNEIFDISC
jgi:N-formylglutamate amidohydrolase